MKVIPVVFDSFETISRGFLKGLEDLKIRRKEKTIETAVLLRLARKLRRILKM